MKTILNNLFTKMKKLLDKVGNFLRGLFSDVVDLIEDKAPLAVKAVQKVKEGIEANEDTIKWITEKTKTQKDDEVFALIKGHLPAVSKELAVIEGLVDADATPEKAMEVYLKYVESKAKGARAKEYIMLASTLLQAIITKKMPLEILVVASQKAFHLLFGKKL
jgi:hypothetical protein